MLCWFGELEAVLAAMAAHLAAWGVIVLSLEAASGTGWQLRRDGRYAHTPECLADAAAASGLALRELDHEVLRVEDGVPIPGLLAVLTR